MGRRIQDTPLPRVAAIYCRVSSEQQARDNKTSLDTQEAGCRQRAAVTGYAVDEQYVYRETHTGEELYERPRLSELRDAAKHHAFGLVIVHSIDRLSRDPIHLGIVIGELERAGVTVEFVTEALDDSPEAALIRFVRGYGAKIENEKRKERSMRAKRERAARGRPIPGCRPPLGYDWGPERDSKGRPTKERLVASPATWPIAERIWRDALFGKTLRRIAAELTADQVPTPGGGERWDPGVIRYILLNPLYWGQPVALRRQLVPVEPHLRKHYAHKSRPTNRPADQQIVLPEGVAPAVVSPVIAAEVHERLRLNQQMASRNNPHPEDALLRGGIARCGLCGTTLMVAHRQGRGRRPRITYLCRAGNRFTAGCRHHGIETSHLDGAVWAKVGEVLRNRTLIEQEVERMRSTETPGTDTLATIDKQRADLERRIANKRKYAELVDDEQERAEVAAEVTDLRKRLVSLETERAAAEQHYATWQLTQAGLESALEWCQRVGENLDTFTYHEKRATLLTLRTDVRLYPTDHTPRAELTIHLPLSGAIALDLSTLDGANSGEHIKAVIQYTRNSYTLQLDDGHDTLIPLSKQSEKELQALLGY
jgi:site-specific DNA recombinase